MSDNTNMPPDDEAKTDAGDASPPGGSGGTPSASRVGQTGPRVPIVAVKPKKSQSATYLGVGLLLLTVFAVLITFGMRYLGFGSEPLTAAGPKDAPQSVTATGVPQIRVAEPAVPKPAEPAASKVVVPSIAEPNSAIQIRDRNGNAVAAAGGGGATGSAAARKPIDPEDAPIFAGGKPEAEAPRNMQVTGGPGTFAPTAQTGDPVRDAQAGLADYQRQMAGALGKLQALIPDQQGTGNAGAGGGGGGGGGVGAGFTPGAGRAVGQAPQAATLEAAAGALFGGASGGTQKVKAGFLGDASMTLPKGTLFTCALKTRVITATAGLVGCQLQRNVFSADGKVVLAERGSHLDGEYRMVAVKPGMTRIPVMWTRLRTPHGVTVDLDSPATGQLGESGMGGYVDNRWGERLGAALLLSLIDDAIKYAITGQQDAANGDNNTVVLPNTTEQGSKLAEKVLETTINIPPLLYNNHGNVVGVYVAKDIDFSSVYELRPQ